MWDCRRLGNMAGWALVAAIFWAGRRVEAIQEHGGPQEQDHHSLSIANKSMFIEQGRPLEEHTGKGNHSDNHTEGLHPAGGHGSHRYHVAQVDFGHVSTPYIISMWVLLASVAKIGFHSTDKLSRIFPESCLLIVLGVLVGIVLYFSPAQGYEMSSKTFFLYLLPPIILEAGYFMPNRAFFDNLGTILLFAVVGTIFNTLLIGTSLWGFTKTGLGIIPFQISILHCMVFAALISAVDPVAVLAVFEEVHVNDILHIVVFGESLLNDGVSVVLYHMFETYSEIGLSNILAVDILAGIGSFFAVAAGGTLIGVVVGFLTAFLSRFTSHVPVIEPLLVFLMGYLSYLTAEVFHFSGILACTFCGITMKRYVEANISKKSHTTIKYFMKMLASVCETIIFVFLGLSTVTNNHEWNTAFILLTLAFCLIYRALGVVVLTALANLFRIQKLNPVEQFIMAYGGLRGAVAFSLVILLNSDVFPQKRLMVTTTVVVIYFTVFLQGVTIKPLVNILRVQKSSKRKPTMNEQIHLRLTDHLMAGIEDITGHFGHNELRERFEYINSKYLKPLLVRRSQLSNTQRGSSIVTVYRKLMEHEAQDFLNRHGSFSLPKIQEEMSRHMSLTRLFQTYSQSSINSAHSDEMLTPKNGTTQNGLPMPDISSHTCLDMKALETQDCRKMKDDSKIHHLLEDSMFKPRKRFSHSRQKHSISEPQISEQVHHTMRYNLRHLVKAPHKPENGVKLAVPEEEACRKPKKNVSFADEIDKHMQLYGNLTMEEVPLKCDMGDPYDSDGESGGADSTNVELSEDKSDSSSDVGITFTVKELAQVPSPPPPPSEPTVAEMMLPWKRNTGREPLSSSCTHAVPDDNIPQLGEAPSWVEPEPQGPSGTPSESSQLQHTPIPENRTNTGPEVPDSIGSVSLPWERGPALVESEVPCTPDPCDFNVSCETFPWRQNGFHDDSECDPRTEAVTAEEKLEEDECPLPPPWKEYTSGSPPCQDSLNGNPSPGLTLSLDIHNGNQACISPRLGWTAEESSIPPPPWRTPSTEADSVPVRSPSCSKELDSFSLQPHPSNHSLRLSEAESRHSEPFPLHHHHVLELPHRGVELDWSAIIEDTDNDEIPHEDTWSRVNAWLLTCDPDKQEHLHDDLANVEITVPNPHSTTLDIDTQSTCL